MHSFVCFILHLLYYKTWYWCTVRIYHCVVFAYLSTTNMHLLVHYIIFILDLFFFTDNNIFTNDIGPLIFFWFASEIRQKICLVPSNHDIPWLIKSSSFTPESLLGKISPQLIVTVICPSSSLSLKEKRYTFVCVSSCVKVVTEMHFSNPSPLSSNQTARSV